ncbi:uncharacterized protein LOC126377241 [Pectinophora gossypiella]|uniref:uncharacterized protein LOC126377241 n=1 Tax=Pectinophora gossypiella TaxID=13191 RepID=UPI00214EDF01|nr:uncharacterized protein LOC126377241 [Pectinophora gossypiella]
MAASVISTPINTISRENLPVLIRNNILNESVEFVSECDTSMMETDSPIRQPNLEPISKKLFHSPLPERSPSEPENTRTRSERNRQSRKRKQQLVPDFDAKIKRVYVKECESDGYSPEVCGGIRKKVLISLFHNKEYSMDF